MEENNIVIKEIEGRFLRGKTYQSFGEIRSYLSRAERKRFLIYYEENSVQYDLSLITSGQNIKDTFLYTEEMPATISNGGRRKQSINYIIECEVIEFKDKFLKLKVTDVIEIEHFSNYIFFCPFDYLQEHFIIKTDIRESNVREIIIKLEISSLSIDGIENIFVPDSVWEGRVYSRLNKFELFYPPEHTDRFEYIGDSDLIVKRMVRRVIEDEGRVVKIRCCSIEYNLTKVLDFDTI